MGSLKEHLSAVEGHLEHFHLLGSKREGLGVELSVLPLSSHGGKSVVLGLPLDFSGEHLLDLHVAGQSHLLEGRLAGRV